MKPILSHYLARLESFVWGKFCAVCETPGNVLCSGCLQGLKSAEGAVGLHHSQPFYDGHRAVFVFNDVVQKLVHRLKYAEGFDVPRFCREEIARVVAKFGKFDAVIPVPLAWKRLRERGYNQSLLLARVFAKSSGQKLLPSVLARIRETQSQTGLNRQHREENVKNAFAVTDPAQILGKRILLVDDVHTTGITLNEAARVLKKSGAVSVWAASLAIVPWKKGNTP